MSAGASAARSAALRGLHVLADDAPHWKLGPVEQAEAACAGGAAVVQLRAKAALDAAALGWAREIRRLTRRSGALFIVNDRFDLALAAAADGVHLGQGDLPPARVRAAVGEALLLGRSTHAAAELRAARQEPVDYVAFGPVFATRSKRSPFRARGLEALAEAVRELDPLPVVAIGGIDAGNLSAVAALGAGAAVISAVAGAGDPEAATRALVALLQRAGAR